MNVRKLYFENQDLTRIKGEPTFKYLHKMLQDITANKGSVPTSLGGWAYDYIGLIFFQFTYATLAPMMTFVAPVMLVVL